MREPFIGRLTVTCHWPLAAADFEVEFVERMEEEECRCVYGSLSRAHKLPNGADRVLALTRTT